MIILDTVRSNRSLVAANQQLRIQLAFSKAEIIRLQNEIVELQQQIAALELTSDGERIEMIVRKRLKVFFIFFVKKLSRLLIKHC